jgi:glycosyltransferase involved in cell wall biosynthesis
MVISWVDYLPHWTNDDPEFITRAVNKLLRLRVPMRWFIDTNADMFFARAGLGYALFTRRLVQRTLARRHVDVLYFHTQTAAWLATDYMKRIPAIVSFDQTAFQLANEKPKVPWSHNLDRAMEQRVFKKAAAIVPFSRWAAKSLIEGHGISADKVHVIPPGVNLQQFSNVHETQMRRDHDGVKRILFIGSDFERKGGRALVEVFLSRFANRNIELHLVTSAAGIPDHPEIITHRDVRAYSDAWKHLYGLADVLVLPARNEAFGLVFVEAMAAGVPVIGTRINAIPEIVEDGETGLLVRPDDRHELAERIERILEDAALRRRLGNNARARASALFDSAKNALKLEDLFVNVSRAPRRSPVVNPASAAVS